MGLQAPANMAIAYFVLDIAGDDAAEKEKDAGITCIEQGETLPGVLVHKHLQGWGARDELMAENRFITPCQEPNAGENDDQVAGKRGDLAPTDLGDGYGKVIQVWLVSVLARIKRAGHGAGGEGGLFCRQGGVGLFDE